jgi:hypothetical protein
MALQRASFQPLIDWCTQGQVGIFLPDIQAFLTEQGQDKDIFYRVLFSGTLSYRPPNALQQNREIIEGTLWTDPLYGPYEATIVIVLNNPAGVEIGLWPRGGPGLIPGDLNLGPSSPPYDMNVLFTDTQNLIKYALDLGKHRSINWRSFHARPGVGLQTGLHPGETVPKAGG